jgi:hypothetical protein
VQTNAARKLEHELASLGALIAAKDAYKGMR